MIDFNGFNLHELRAIAAVLNELTDEMISYDGPWYEIAFKECALARVYERNAEKQFIKEQAPAAADPPAPPDMFGWVGDALDDLCAAGEVLGADE